MTKKLFHFTAEHIDRSKGVALVRKLENECVEVEAAAMDPVFSDQFHMIVTATQDEAEKIRDQVWYVNHGAYCDMVITTEDTLDW